MSNKYEMILAIVNAGFSETVMEAAKEVGARGGTVIHARGTANKEAEQFFHITIQPDKEIVMILVAEEIKDDVLHAIYKSAGLKTEGQGIAFSLAVDEVVGISFGTDKDKSADKKSDKAAAGQEPNKENIATEQADK